MSNIWQSYCCGWHRHHDTKVQIPFVAKGVAAAVAFGDSVADRIAEPHLAGMQQPSHDTRKCLPLKQLAHMLG